MTIYRIIVIVIVLIFLGSIGFHFYTEWDLKQFQAEINRSALPLEHQHTADCGHTSEDRITGTDTPADFGSVFSHAQKNTKPESEGKLTQIVTVPHEHGPEGRFPSLPQEEAEEIIAWFIDIDTRLRERYPDVIEFPTLTSDEFARRYPTLVDRQRFHQRCIDMGQEFMGELRDLFSRLPDDELEPIVAKMHEQLTHNWGHEAADQMIAVFYANLNR